MTPQVRLEESRLGTLFAHFDKEPELPDHLLSLFLHDFERQEDLVLREIAKAEAGEAILDLYNNHVHVYLYPKLAVIEDMGDPNLEEDDAEGPRRCTFLTLEEAKQLILDWLEAKKRWYTEHGKDTPAPPPAP